MVTHQLVILCNLASLASIGAPSRPPPPPPIKSKALLGPIDGPLSAPVNLSVPAAPADVTARIFI